MPVGKTVHTPGCFYTMWIAGAVQKFKLFSLTPTLRAHPSSEGEGHWWVSGSRALSSHPFAACPITCLKILKLCWRISLLVRGASKIQHLFLSTVIIMHMKKKKNCRDSVKELWMCEGSTAWAHVLLHHLGSNVWKEGWHGVKDSGCWAATPPRSSLPLSSPSCKDSPRVREKNTVLKCFAVA